MFNFWSKYWDWDRMIEWYKPSWWSIYRPGVTRPVVSVFLVIHCLPLPPNTNTILLTTLYTLALTTPAIFLVLIFIYFPGPSFTVWGLSVSGERSRGKLRYFSHFLIRSFISFLSRWGSWDLDDLDRSWSTLKILMATSKEVQWN